MTTFNFFKWTQYIYVNLISVLNEFFKVSFKKLLLEFLIETQQNLFKILKKMSEYLFYQIMIKSKSCLVVLTWQSLL